MPCKKDKTNQTQTKANKAVPNTLNGSKATDQQSYEKNKPKHEPKKSTMPNGVTQFHLIRHSGLNTEVSTVNTIDAVIVEFPTKHGASDDQNTEVKVRPAINYFKTVFSQSPLHQKNIQYPYTATRTRSEIVILLEMCTDKLNTSKKKSN